MFFVFFYERFWKGVSNYFLVKGSITMWHILLKKKNHSSIFSLSLADRRSLQGNVSRGVPQGFMLSTPLHRRLRQLHVPTFFLTVLQIFFFTEFYDNYPHVIVFVHLDLSQNEHISWQQWNVQMVRAMGLAGCSDWSGFLGSERLRAAAPHLQVNIFKRTPDLKLNWGTSSSKS